MISRNCARLDIDEQAINEAILNRRPDKGRSLRDEPGADSP
jgi:hypothetical protein